MPLLFAAAVLGSLRLDKTHDMIATPTANNRQRRGAVTATKRLPKRPAHAAHAAHRQAGRQAGRQGGRVGGCVMYVTSPRLTCSSPPAGAWPSTPRAAGAPARRSPYAACVQQAPRISSAPLTPTGANTGPNGSAVTNAGPNGSARLGRYVALTPWTPRAAPSCARARACGAGPSPPRVRCGSRLRPPPPP
eukprot:SAG25_NODE_192_length_12211_cov_44.011394_12_plen_191_part_00